MRLVLDTNVLFAGILRDGTTRDLLIDPPMQLLAPERALTEIRRNAEAISSRSKLSLDGVELLLALLTEDIEVVPRQNFEDELSEARDRIGDKDPGDVPFLAVALANLARASGPRTSDISRGAVSRCGTPSRSSAGCASNDSLGYARRGAPSRPTPNLIAASQARSSGQRWSTASPIETGSA